MRLYLPMLHKVKENRNKEVQSDPSGTQQTVRIPSFRLKTRVIGRQLHMQVYPNQGDGRVEDVEGSQKSNKVEYKSS